MINEFAKGAVEEAFNEYVDYLNFLLKKYDVVTEIQQPIDFEWFDEENKFNITGEIEGSSISFEKEQSNLKSDFEIELDSFNKIVESNKENPYSVIVGNNGEKFMEVDFSMNNGAFICGHTGSGKTSLMRSIVEQLSEKDNKPIMYAHCKGNEFVDYISDKNIANDLNGAYNISKTLNNIALDRERTAGLLKLKNLHEPFEVENGVLINDMIFDKKDVLKCKKFRNTPDEISYEVVAGDMYSFDDDHLPDFIEIVGTDGNKHEVPFRKNRFDGDKLFAFDPIYFFVDEYANLIDLNGQNNIAKSKSFDFENNINYLFRFGRAFNIHVILSSQNSSSSVLPSSLKNNIPVRFLCGRSDENVMRHVVETEMPSLPSKIGYCYMYDRGDVDIVKMVYEAQ